MVLSLGTYNTASGSLRGGPYTRLEFWLSGAATALTDKYVMATIETQFREFSGSLRNITLQRQGRSLIGQALSLMRSFKIR